MWLWPLIKWLHVLGAVIWIGGIFFVVFMLRPALMRLDQPAARQAVLSGAVARMRRIMNLVITTQVVTGSVMLWNRRQLWENLLTSTWGLLLLAKLLLAVTMVSLYIIVPRLLLASPGQGDSCEHESVSRRKQKLGQMLHILMLGLGFTVLLLAKFLV